MKNEVLYKAKFLVGIQNSKDIYIEMTITFDGKLKRLSFDTNFKTNYNAWDEIQDDSDIYNITCHKGILERIVQIVNDYNKLDDYVPENIIGELIDRFRQFESKEIICHEFYNFNKSYYNSYSSFIS